MLALDDAALQLFAGSFLHSACVIGATYLPYLNEYNYSDSQARLNVYVWNVTEMRLPC
jgi:hypothetical protein